MLFIQNRIVRERKETPMNDFIARYRDRISGVITGFERLVLRGNPALNQRLE
jgi:hypothetical protein